METVTLNVGGMTCQGCVSSVARVLKGIQGVDTVDVSLERCQATVVYDPGMADTKQLRQAIENAGFEAG